MTTPEEYADLGEAAWRWVLAQVRWDEDGPWIPVSLPHEGGPPEDDRDGMHSGIGGLAHVLAEVREARPWTEEEHRLADGIATRIRGNLATTTAYSYFDGLVSDLGVLSALQVDGSEQAVARLAELAHDDGWEQPWMPSPPVPEPTSISALPTPLARARVSWSWRSRPTAIAFTSGLPL